MNIDPTFTAVLFGRPNVGKSTLFNRLVGKKLALVDDQPGVTRDVRYGVCTLAGVDFSIADTPGLESVENDSLQARMTVQTQRVIEKSQLALFVIDGIASVTPEDKIFCQWLRRASCPVIVVVNKCEGAKGDTGYLESFNLGFSDVVRISAAHGAGIDDFLQMIEDHITFYQAQASLSPSISDQEAGAEINHDLHMAIIGRPNSGKSTLINTLLKEERMLTGPEAGITRDSISVNWQWRDTNIKLVDTAGIRRRARVKEKLEVMSVQDSLRSLKYAQLVVLMTDAESAMESHDLRLASYAVDEGRALVIVVNKWDTVTQPKKVLQTIRDRVEKGLNQIKGVHIITMSALTGQGISKLMDAVLNVWELYNSRVPTGELNQWLKDMVSHNPPPLISGRRLKIRYVTQACTRPQRLLFS